MTLRSDEAAEDRYRGWVRPGPRVPGGPQPATGETLDYLCGHYRIFQYERGHRYSTDDVLTAWYGTICAPRVALAADLGSGIGSVAMITAWRLPGAQLFTLERQQASLRLAEKSREYNGLDGRLHLFEGDLRNQLPFPEDLRFDLVTGSPPYFPPGSATEAQHPQAVPARIEMAGTIADYARAASGVLAAGGVFVFVFPSAENQRADDACRDHGLLMLRERAVIFKEGKPPLITLYACGRTADFPSRVTWHEPPLTIRDRSGAITAEYAAVRMSFGFPPGDVGPER